LFLLARLREPSTYAGLPALLQAAGIHLSEPVEANAVRAAIALAGLLAVLMPEKS
jgi:hypothetical protein